MDKKKKEKIKVVIWGASGHAKVIAGILEMNSSYELLGFLDDANPERKGQAFCGKRILGGREQLRSLRKKNVKHIALGFGNCLKRNKVGNFLVDQGISPLTVCHPTYSMASDVEIGQGTVIMAGAIIDPACRIGNYCIINNNSVVCHDAVIEDAVHICPGVHVAGQVTIGLASWVGIGSCISDHVNIGARSYIGAGSVVVKDIPGGVLAYGNPARVIRPIDHDF